MINEFKTAGPVMIDLEGCLVQVEASKAWFTRRVLPLSIEQLRWRPNPARWSIAECLDHLNLTLRLYLPKVDAAISVGCKCDRIRPSIARYEQGEMKTLKMMEPPVTAAVAAPPAVIPAAAVDPDWLVEQFHQTREQYADAVRRAEGLELPGILVVEPIFPAIRSLGGTLALLAAHDRRHMWQAEQVRNAPRFPRTVFTAPTETRCRINY